MTEMDRYKKALGVALEALRHITSAESGNIPPTQRGAYRILKQKEIDEILAPPPEYETADVARWECDLCGAIRSTDPHNDLCICFATGNDTSKWTWTKLTGTRRTPKPRMVERSVVIPIDYDRFSNIGTVTVTIPPEAQGKSTAITIGWLEPEGGVPSK